MVTDSSSTKKKEEEESVRLACHLRRRECRDRRLHEHQKRSLGRRNNSTSGGTGGLHRVSRACNIHVRISVELGEARFRALGPVDRSRERRCTKEGSRVSPLPSFLSFLSPRLVLVSLEGATTTTTRRKREKRTEGERESAYSLRGAL